MTQIAARDLAPLLKRAEKASPSFDRARLLRALEVAGDLYGDEVHWTGEALLDHVVGSLEALAPFEPDEDALIACLLHHVLENKRMAIQDLEREFGPRVRALVSGIHLLTFVTLEGRRSSIEDLRLVLLSVSDDVRIVLIALGSWLHVLPFLGSVPAEEARRVGRDILQLYAPVAARLGMYHVKHGLENGAFPFMYPYDCALIREQLERVHAEHPVFLDRASEALRAFLVAQGIRADIEAREKLPYSIFQKMQKKSISDVRELYDLFALRVIVEREEDCYQALGLLHRTGRPVPNRFKDYIAFPKPNGYQGLHTTLSHPWDLPDNLFIEVQVRTHEMNREAKYGIAAHWSYKEGGTAMRALERVQIQKMLLGQEQIGEAGESLLADHIYVLTPRGDIIELPEGATPLDFAFQIHTDLGLSFRAARVNGAIVPLHYQLENGDVVEVQKSRTPRPSPEWLQALKMASSRSKLKRYLYAQRRTEFLAKGRVLCNAELAKHGCAPLTTDLALLRRCDGQELSMTEREDLLVKLGQESEKPASLLPRLDALRGKIAGARAAANAPAVAGPVNGGVDFRRPRTEVDFGISMPYRFAKCCKPDELPQDPAIAGMVSRAGGIIVHRVSCRMIRASNPERRVEVRWKA